MPWFKEILSRRSCGSCFFTRVWWTCSPQSLKSLYHFKMTIIVYWYLMGVRLFCWNIFVGLTRWHYIVGRKSLAICSIIFGNNVFFKNNKTNKRFFNKLFDSRGFLRHVSEWLAQDVLSASLPAHLQLWWMKWMKPTTGTQIRLKACYELY